MTKNLPGGGRREREEGELRHYGVRSLGDGHDSVMTTLNCTLYNGLGDK